MNEQGFAPVSGAPRSIAWCMGGMIALLFLTAVGYRFLHPDMLTPLPPPRENAAQRPQADSVMAGVSALMQRLQANPQDTGALISLSEHFLHLEEWTSAEQFARRAATADPGDMKPHYLLSVALHGLGKHAEAAASLEQALAIKDDPALRYSLGILYAYYLNDKAKAAEQLRKGLADPAVSGQLKKDLQEELTKLDQ